MRKLCHASVWTHIFTYHIFVFLILACFCVSEIYCYGPVLDELQKAKLFDDNKYLVDMNLREPPGKLSHLLFISFMFI